MKKTLAILIVLGLCLLLTNCERKLKSSTGPPLSFDVPPTPKNISVQIGDKSVTLNWSVDSLSGINRFKIYRSDSVGVDPQLYDSTASAVTRCSHGTLVFPAVTSFR